MNWGNRLIIALALMLLTHAAHAKGIEKFTDSQGTLHITNLGPKPPDNPVNQPSPGASSLPSRLRSIPPVAPPTKDPVPKAKVPEPEIQPAPEIQPEPQTQQEPPPGVVPNEPVPGNPQPDAGVRGRESETFAPVSLWYESYSPGFNQGYVTPERWRRN